MKQMKNFSRILLLFVALCCLALPAFSQGKKKLKLPGKVKVPKLAVPNLGGGDKVADGSQVTLDFDAQPYAPTVGLASLHQYLQLTLDGKLSMRNFEGYFMPDKRADGKAADLEYGGLYRVELYQKGGAEALGVLHYYTIDMRQPYTKMEQRRGTPTNGLVNELQVPGAGQYELRFFAGDREYYRYPLEIIVKDGGPYSAYPKAYFMNGLWDDYVLLSRESSTNQQNVIAVNYYVATQDADVGSRGDVSNPVAFNFRVDLRQGGKVIGTSRLRRKTSGSSPEPIFDKGYGKRGIWEMPRATMSAYPAKPGNASVPAPFRTFDQLSDGNYEVVIQLQRPDGSKEERRYGFTMKDHQVVPPAEADRARHTDPLTFLEQGRDYYYAKRK